MRMPSLTKLVVGTYHHVTVDDMKVEDRGVELIADNLPALMMLSIGTFSVDIQIKIESPREVRRY